MDKCDFYLGTTTCFQKPSYQVKDHIFNLLDLFNWLIDQRPTQSAALQLISQFCCLNEYQSVVTESTDRLKVSANGSFIQHCRLPSH